MQRLADQLVGDVRAVVIASVDVVYPTRDRLAQHGHRRVRILWRAKHTGAGEPHGAIAEPLHDAVAKRKRTGLINSGHDRSPLSLALSQATAQNWVSQTPLGLDEDQRRQLLASQRRGNQRWAGSPPAARAPRAATIPLRRRAA